MDLFKIIAIGIITVVCTILMKQIKPEISIFVVITGSIIILFMILQSLGSVFADYKYLLEKTSINPTIFGCVLKIIGIGYLTEFACDICSDAGVNSISQKISLAGKILIFITCLPIVENLLKIILALLP